MNIDLNSQKHTKTINNIDNHYSTNLFALVCINSIFCLTIVPDIMIFTKEIRSISSSYVSYVYSFVNYHKSLNKRTACIHNLHIVLLIVTICMYLRNCVFVSTCPSVCNRFSYEPNLFAIYIKKTITKVISE